MITFVATTDYSYYFKPDVCDYADAIDDAVDFASRKRARLPRLMPPRRHAHADDAVMPASDATPRLCCHAATHAAATTVMSADRMRRRAAVYTRRSRLIATSAAKR